MVDTLLRRRRGVQWKRRYCRWGLFRRAGMTGWRYFSVAINGRTPKSQHLFRRMPVPQQPGTEPSWLAGFVPWRAWPWCRCKSLGSVSSNGASRTVSAAARPRISLAQKARWAKQRTDTPKRTISAAVPVRAADYASLQAPQLTFEYFVQAQSKWFLSSTNFVSTPTLVTLP